jgi:hypothetical protein
MDIECGTRDMQPMQKLMELSTAQGILTHLMRSGLNPDDALNAWLDHL